MLADAGLVRDAWQGRQRMWEFDVQRLDAARRCIDDISEQWHRALLRLKAFVEDEQH